MKVILPPLWCDQKCVSTEELYHTKLITFRKEVGRDGCTRKMGGSWLYKKIFMANWMKINTSLFDYASGGKHAKHRYILAVNLPDTFRCPKRQIATKKYKIICLSSMCYLNQKKSNAKYNLRTAFSRFAPQLTIRFKQIFDLSRMAWHIF